jgi:hypothetical protein
MTDVLRDAKDLDSIVRNRRKDEAKGTGRNDEETARDRDRDRDRDDDR